MNWKRKMMNSFRSMELAKKIMLLVFGISVLQISMILFISNHLSIDIITEQVNELTEKSLEQSAGNIQAALERYDNLIQEIYMDTSIVENLKIINSWDGEKYYLSIHSLNQKIQDIIYRNEEIAGIALVGKYGDVCYYDGITRSNQESVCFEKDLKNNNFVKQVMRERESLYSPLTGVKSSDYGKHTFLYIGHQLIDINNYEKGAIGCVIFCINEEKFRETYSSGIQDNSLSFLIDVFGNLISIPREGFEETNIFGNKETHEERTIQEVKEQIHIFAQDTKLFPKKNMDVNAISVSDGGFYIANLQDLSDSTQRIHYLLLMIFIAAALAVTVGFAVVYYISVDIDKSVKKILRAMGEADRGNLNSKIEVTGSDEFAKISRHFNQMLGKIKKSNEQEREILLREKNAEIRSLEAQINPHFLYNTLDTINWLAVEEQQFSISRMVTKLAQILRYSIHNSNEIVSIETELEYVKKYIYLQQERFEYSFDCTIEVEEQVRKYPIHKLLVQPIVENTIIHGFSGLERRGEIHISARLEDEKRIIIEIADNGVGMEEEEWKKFNDFDYRKEKIESSIGIRNVITRMKLYYGEKGDVHFYSDGKGTVVQMMLPVENKEEQR